MYYLCIMIFTLIEKTEILKNHPGWTWNELSIVENNMNISSLDYIEKLLENTKTKKEIEQKIKELKNSKI